MAQGHDLPRQIIRTRSRPLIRDNSFRQINGNHFAGVVLGQIGVPFRG